MAEMNNMVRTASTISVDAGKLSCGLKATFEGITMVFESLGIPIEIKMTERMLKKLENVSEADSVTASDLETVKTAFTEPPVSTAVSIDDITKIIVKKIKKDRKNSEKIREILNNYGASKVVDLPNEKYEAFLTDLSAI